MPCLFSCLRGVEMFGFFKHKRELGKLQEEVQGSFDLVKEDFKKVGKWIGHFDEKHNKYNEDLSELKKKNFCNAK